MGKIFTPIFLYLDAVVEHGAEHVERRLQNRITRVFVAAKGKVENRGDRNRIVEALRGAGRGASAGNPFLEGSHINGYACEAGERSGAIQPRARQKYVRRRAILKAPIQPPEEHHSC